MRERWVACYVGFCLLQLPLYLWLGSAPLAYDQALDSAEETLRAAPTAQQAALVRSQLATAEQALSESATAADSRWARLDQTAAVLAWHEGNIAAADAFFRRALERLESSHGPDSLPGCLASLQYAEFLMAALRYEEALWRLEVGVPQLEQALGPDSSLVTRSRFARVVVLSGLGREDEAVRQANPGLQRLLQQAAQLDEMFLSRLGGSLDPLRDRGLAPPPEPSQGWRQALLTAHAAGRAGADLDEAQ